MALRLRILLALVAAAGLLFAAAPPASPAAAPIYSGTGWKIATRWGIYSLNPDPYTVVWADTAARTKLKPYMTKSAAHATSVTGVQITVSDTIDTSPADVCPARHRIVVRYSYRPVGLEGISQARPCYETTNGSAWGGNILIDNEYWLYPGWFSADPVRDDTYRANVVAHELGHILGLDHANVDLDKDGKVEDQECVATSGGNKPLLCSPVAGGYHNPTDAGKFVLSFDVPGLRQLAANWNLR
ncbi:hypothetical protein ACWCPF_25730 [Streptomyces sp. NPDC001858]